MPLTGRPTRTSSTASSAPVADRANDVARPERAARERLHRERRADLRKRDGEAGLGQAVHGKHHVGREARGRERREEFAAQVRRDRLGAVEDDANGGQVERRDLGRIVRLADNACSRNSAST